MCAWIISRGRFRRPCIDADAPAALDGSSDRVWEYSQDRRARVDRAGGLPDNSPIVEHDKPLALYRERLLSVSRVIELHADRLAVRAHWRLGRSYRMSVSLKALRPKYTEVWIRQKLFRRGLALALLLAAAAVVLDLPRAGRPPQVVIYAAYGAAIALGALAALAWPKVLFVRFSSSEGKPGLDIARAGPDRRSFDDFVSQIVKQIRQN
jgi:hypothetical protein